MQSLSQAYAVTFSHTIACIRPICSACLLATELEIKDFFDAEDNSHTLWRAMIIPGASYDTFAKSGP